MPKISVGIRLRPDHSNQPKLDQLNINTDRANIELFVSNTLHSFNFDQIFSDGASQTEVYKNSTIRLIDNALEGYNGCIFAYGQTGAGKTHTISGTLDGDVSQYGICGQTAVTLFQKTKQTFDNISYRLSILEIYNESLVDLLVDLPSQNGIINTKGKLNIIETDRGVLIPGLHILPIDTLDDCLTLLIEAQANRAVAEHQLNHVSSRSHIIYTYYITRTSTSAATSTSNGAQRLSAKRKDREKDNHQVNDGDVNDPVTIVEDPIVHQSKLHIVDLAGSERVNKTGSVGNVQKEANYINRSLSYLEQVVIALSQSNRDHIPYRQSKLTYLLKDSLGGNSNTYLIACIWPRKDHSWETLSTLRFAARMKSIETHPIRNRLVSKENNNGNGNNTHVKQLTQQVDLLKKELAMRDFVHQYDSWMPELTKQQILQTYQQSIEFVLQPSSTMNHTAPNQVNNRNGGNDTQNNTASSDNPSQIHTIDPINIHSLSQMNLIVKFYQEMIQELAENNPEKIQQAIQNVIEKRYMNSSSIHFHEKYSKLGKKILSLVGNHHHQDDRKGGKSAKIETVDEGFETMGKPTMSSPAAVPFSPVSKTTDAAPLASAVPNNSTASNTAPTRQGEEDQGGLVLGGGNELQPVNNEYFQQFIQSSSAGNDLHSAYEELKETLKNNKKRQKEIITLLNDQKYIIDELNIEINQYLNILKDHEEGRDGVGDPEGEGIERNDSLGNNPSSAVEPQDDEAMAELQNTILEKKEKLDGAKKQYRTVHQELLLCKEQISETQSLKKRAMTALLMAFNDYMKQLPGAEG